MAKPGGIDIGALLSFGSRMKARVKQEFPKDAAGIDSVLHEMAPNYNPDAKILRRTHGVRGMMFRYNNNTRGLHGFVKAKEQKGNLILPLRDTKPVYTFPHTAGLNFTTDAPDGVYTWVLYENDGVTGFAATLVENKMEMGSGHDDTLVKLGIDKEFKVPSAGELIKEGHTLHINISSGTYMLHYINAVAEKYIIDERSVNGLLLAHAQKMLRATLPGFTVLFDVGSHEIIPKTLITASSTPLTYTAMKELANAGGVGFDFISNENLRKHGLKTLSTSGENGMNLPNWRPFLPSSAAVASAGGGGASTSGGASAAANTRRRRPQRKRRMTRRH